MTLNDPKFDLEKSLDTLKYLSLLFESLLNEFLKFSLE